MNVCVSRLRALLREFTGAATSCLWRAVRACKSRIGLLASLLALQALLAAGAAQAQADLEFPKSAAELGMFSGLGVGIWKPEGDGPFPAVILVHTCGGLKRQLVHWRSEAVKRGYVAFIIDSFSARGTPMCRPVPPISLHRGVRDVLQAAEHLRGFPFVDKSRIATIGMSWGAMVGLAASSKAVVDSLGERVARIDATVNLYPMCSFVDGIQLPADDIAVPTLILAGDKDTETPAAPCVRRLPEMRDRGAPVEWHVFPDATHCWDCSDLHGYRWSPPWAGGRQVVYLYDSGVTQDSADRVFEFLARRLQVGGTASGAR